MHILPRLALAPLPLLFLQPVLDQVVRHIVRKHPELFNRLGSYKDKTFLIDPVNLPFALLLHPDPDRPRLKTVRRHSNLIYDARIAGSFHSLFSMVDGRLDGDALFFTRDLMVDGDTAATVCLRNAIDDLEGSIVDDVAAMFGPPGRMTIGALRYITRNENGN
jgi:predicted lipid carrier protein YhbT